MKTQFSLLRPPKPTPVPLLTFVLWSFMAFQSQGRVWTDLKGNTLDAEYVGVSKSSVPMVTLKTINGVVRLPLKQLIKSDQSYIAENADQLEASAAAARTKGLPNPLVATQEWTRSSDKKKLTAALVHVRGNTAVFLSGGKYFAIKPSLLETTDQELIQEAAKRAPAFCIGHIDGVSKSTAQQLMGKAVSVSETGKYLDFGSRDLRIAVRFENGRAVHVLMDFGFEGSLEELIGAMGLSHLSKGRKIEKGILEQYALTSEQGVFELLLTPKGNGGYSVVNISLPSKG